MAASAERLTRVQRMALTKIAMGSVIYSLAAVVALHGLNTCYDAISQPLSYYAVGAYGWLMASALGAFAVGTFAFGDRT